MGQKVNPNGFRVGVIRDWNARWYASKKDFADFLVEDNKIREFVKKKYYGASISRIGIERAAGKITVSIYTARPGLLIGKGGAGIDEIKASIAQAVGKPVNVNIMEVRDADADAQLVAENIAAQLLPPRDEAGDGPLHAEAGREGHQAHVLGASGRRRDRPHRGVPRRFHPAADHARGYPLRLCRGAHDLRPHRLQGLDLQGRGPRQAQP